MGETSGTSPSAGRTVQRTITLRAPRMPAFDRILTQEALDFVAALQREFNPTREALLQRRVERQAEWDRGARPDFLPDTAAVRAGDWSVADTPAPLEQRWVEITGPAERKMMINALNSGTDVFMADLEDALSPTWENAVHGQINLSDAARRAIRFESPDGRVYELHDQIATLLVRPRGWHLVEKHMQVDGQPVSASLFDFGLCFFHNARALLDRGQGPYFYLPKLESHLEARLWNDVFNSAQEALAIPRGSVRATVLIETIPAAFEMDEILYELRDHAGGLNAGRWDYIFSIIKRFHRQRAFLLPDRGQVTMTVPFMRAFTELLVQTCHRRGAHAIGGMSAFIPNRRDPDVNAIALAKVREDKLRESGDGFDGTWVAHPDLIAPAREVFDQALAGKPHQKERLREDVHVRAADLLNTEIPRSSVTADGVRTNVSIALQYLNAWLQGTAAVAINNLMEDAATAEISRAQLWQWLHHETVLDDGRPVVAELYERTRHETLQAVGGAERERYGEAAQILDDLVLNDRFEEFLTLPAYGYLD